MATRTARPRPLSNEQLQEVLALTKQADTVELKLTVPDANQRSSVLSLGMDPLEGQIRQVVFFDTPDLKLDDVGLVVRARRVQGKGDDSVVKLRPIDPSAVRGKLRKTPGFGIEVDAMPGGFVCSGSLKNLEASGVWQVLAGERPIRKLFSKPQRALFAEHAPPGIELDDLSILGPINVFKLKFSSAGLNQRMVAELWLYPNGTRILELSTKCKPGEAFQVAAEARAHLGSKGVDLAGVQQTKTRTALEFFADELTASG
jgi:hypothetical protein